MKYDGTNLDDILRVVGYNANIRNFNDEAARNKYNETIGKRRTDFYQMISPLQNLVGIMQRIEEEDRDFFKPTQLDSKENPFYDPKLCMNIRAGNGSVYVAVSDFNVPLNGYPYSDIDFFINPYEWPEPMPVYIEINFASKGWDAFVEKYNHDFPIFKSMIIDYIDEHTQPIPVKG